MKSWNPCLLGLAVGAADGFPFGLSLVWEQAPCEEERVRSVVFWRYIRLVEGAGSMPGSPEA